MNESALFRAYGIPPTRFRPDRELVRDAGHDYHEPAVLAELVVHVIDVHGRPLYPGAIDAPRLEGLHAKLHGWTEGELRAAWGDR